MKKTINIRETLVFNEIGGKNSAIHAYDKIIWQIRTGYLSLFFGGWAFILKGAIENSNTIHQIKIYILMMVGLSLALSVSAFFIDRNYIRRKFRVIYSLTTIQEILYSADSIIEKLSREEKEELSKHIGIVGDSGNQSYKGKGFNQELNVSYLIYSITIIFCTVPVLLLYMN